MAISFSNALGVHEAALGLRTKRAEVLASNLTNVDTPNYKARDIDFKSALKSQLAMTGNAASMKATNSKHFGVAQGQGVTALDLKYRVPLQPSLDGNTVDEQSEMSRFAKNTMDFQASFQFLNGKFKGLSKAIKGEI
ncbi:flagellar basal body rod protein FlgB [Dasania marina]|uniref:flagellar basal body rod protein FlgB n=1 Tax=Dasania marina TaxID=471499 RepID=UPI0003730723|nr:flagellar basal body rod protein FlgB [Dasania marina]|tara:strand:- start:62152 stop:62562 length:411 start_codon:yes stop_codon:yes gene_type:complete